MTGRVLESEGDEDEADAEQAKLIPRDRVLLVVPLEGRRIVEGEPGLREALADLGAERLCGSALRGRKLAPQQVRHAAVEVAEAPVDRQLEAPLRLGRLGRRHSVGARDDDEVLATQVVGRAAHHPQLADELVRRDQRLARDVPAALGHHLVLEMSRRDAGVDVQLDGALDVEEVAVARVHVDHDRRDLEVDGRRFLLRVANGHRQLELAQSTDGAPGAVRDLDRRVQVHVRGAEMPDGERVAAEVDGVEAVVHEQLRAHRVVDPRGENVGLLGQQPAEALAGRLVARSRHLVAVRKQRRGYELHQWPPRWSVIRFRGRSCRARGTRTRARCLPCPRPAIGFLYPCLRNYQESRYTSNRLW